MERFEHGYALLISINENAVPAWALPSVVNDVVGLNNVLTHPERCAYPNENVKVIMGKEATRQGILDGLDWLHERVEGDGSGEATAVVYYTGHGWRDEAAKPAYYLIPYDVRQDDLRGRAVRAEDFAGALRSLEARRLLAILDCCHSGGMEVKGLGDFQRSALPPGAVMAEEAVTPEEGAKGLGALAQGEGRAVLSSSRGEQLSYILRDRTMSIFTYCLIAALTGHAQPQEGAKEVLVSDVMSYVWRHVPERAREAWGAKQQPDYQVSGNFPVALLLGGEGLSKGQPAPDPREATFPEGVGRFSYVSTGGGDYIGGDAVGGDKITTGDISGTGIAIGRGARASVTSGVTRADLEQAFAPVLAALAEAPPEQRAAAQRELEILKEEAYRPGKADDSRMAGALEALVALVPSAAGAMASAFVSPLLAGLAGPVTRYVLEKIGRR